MVRIVGFGDWSCLAELIADVKWRPPENSSFRGQIGVTQQDGVRHQRAFTKIATVDIKRGQRGMKRNMKQVLLLTLFFARKL